MSINWPGSSCFLAKDVLAKAGVANAENLINSGVTWGVSALPGTSTFTQWGQTFPSAIKDSKAFFSAVANAQVPTLQDMVTWCTNTSNACTPCGSPCTYATCGINKNFWIAHESYPCICPAGTTPDTSGGTTMRCYDPKGVVHSC